MPELEIHTIAGLAARVDVDTIKHSELLKITKDIYNDILKKTGEMTTPESYWQGTVDLNGDGKYLDISNMGPTIKIVYDDNKGIKHTINEERDLNIFKQKLRTPLPTCSERLGCMLDPKKKSKVRNNKKNLKIPNKLYVTFEKNPKIDAAIKKRDEENARTALLHEQIDHNEKEREKERERERTAQIQHQQDFNVRLRDAEFSKSPSLQSRLVIFKNDVQATKQHLERVETARKKRTKAPTPRSPPKTTLGVTGRGINKKSRKKKVKPNKTKRKRRTVRCSKYKKGKCVSKRQKRKLN